MKTLITETSKFSRSLTVLMLLAALLVACGPRPAAAGDQVPFLGSARGAITNVVPDAGGLILTVTATGKATHLGQFSRSETLLFNPATGAISGSITFTAANGDQLVGTVTGQFTSATTVAGTYTFTGGTGRFEDASGTADFSLSTSDGVNFTVQFEGSLSSVGSNN